MAIINGNDQSRILGEVQWCSHQMCTEYNINVYEMNLLLLRR